MACFISRAIFFVVFILGAVECWAGTNNSEYGKRKAVVHGRVINQSHESPKVLTVISCNPLDENDRFAVRLDSTGLFHVEFEMFWAHSFTISYHGKFINAFVEPEDSLFLEIDAEKFRYEGVKSVRFVGKNATRSTEFNRLFDDLVGVINYKPLAENLNASLDSFMALFQKEINLLNDTIKSYSAVHEISPWVQELMKDMALFTLSNYAIGYSGQSNEDELGFFTQDIFDIYDADNFRNMMFVYHLDTYYNKWIAKDVKFKDCIKRNDVKSAEQYALGKILTMPKSLARDIMLYRLYDKSLSTRFELKEELFLCANVYDKLFAKSSKVVSINLTGLSCSKDVLYMTAEDSIEQVSDFDLEYLLKEQYKGKVVYVDVWATWCGPCRAEMASARELHRLFAKEDVVFVNLCLSSKADAWVSILQEEQLTGENYFFDEDFSAEVAAKLLSGGFPTYILIDKNGTVRDKNAPRPSGLSAISTAIDALLTEQYP
ncbi:redoxin family protein [Bacteroides pyogenes F0041]|uniref:Redoxin family protein n=1 Tax=Bacteroides pyogenes F0041 TaxID=1321819 RepID=U2DJM9_9BACE|nr:TlpA disulfide reductase family protein [Bacteroides pyogenes]ERI81697.1 redoxin family protein [Bacteroides pyogenes F0041]MBB3893984.1 thiol-disulfide isomerase/thioredoxin [Bacteroides pyogenes]GAE20954.1 putative thioredoxin family protein [Bacteroides pyogenes JCM 10003]SUV31599.1 Redoxin domain protein [Bacteroides pyogenes]